jgi:hypothetical protein
MILSRPVKFFIIEKLLLPLASAPFRCLMKTWRVRVLEAETLERMAATSRLVLVTYHGMLLHILPFGSIAARYGRRIVVMTSPSYDGRLLATFLRRLGVASVRGSSRSRSITGAKNLISRIKAGDIGLIAVDGPRGPRCVAKPGFLKIAAAADAHLLLVTTSASRGITFGTWDGAHLPAPFARVRLSLQLLPPPERENLQRELAEVQDALVAAAREIGSPVLRGSDPTPA